MVEEVLPDVPYVQLVFTTRQRRARGPPPDREIFTTVSGEEFSQLPPQEEEDLNQDLLGGEEPL